MSTVSKTAGDRVSSTSGGGTVRKPATQALSARTESQQALGPLRLGDTKFSSPEALLASVEMLVNRASLQDVCDLDLTAAARDNAGNLQDHVENLSMYLRQALAALPVDPKNNTSRDVLRLACASGFELVKQLAALDMAAVEMAERLLARPAIGGVQ
jgi:hypothetical protein